MSLFSSIANVAKGIFKPVISTLKTTGKSLLGGVASTLFEGATSAIGGGAGGAPPTTTPSAGGVVQTLPALRQGYPTYAGLPTIPQAGTPAPGGMARSIGAGLGSMISAATGMSPAGFTKTKRGKLTGNMIPVGYQERMSSSGVIYLAKAKRRRGITARDLSAYRRVDRLISRYHKPHRRGK